MRDRRAPGQVAAVRGARAAGVEAPEQIWSQRTVKLSRPSGSSAWTSTAVTRAAGGPWLHHSTSSSNASGSPSATISTRPSGRLRAQPEMPSARAFSAQLPRYQTPCTLPLTHRCRRTNSQKLAALYSNIGQGALDAGRHGGALWAPGGQERTPVAQWGDRAKALARVRGTPFGAVG